MCDMAHIIYAKWIPQNGLVLWYTKIKLMLNITMLKACNENVINKSIEV